MRMPPCIAYEEGTCEWTRRLLRSAKARKRRGGRPLRSHSSAAPPSLSRPRRPRPLCPPAVAMYAQDSPSVSSPYLPQPVPQRPYSNYDRFDAVPRPTSRPSGSPSRPPRSSPRPPAASEQPYDEYTYDNGSPSPPDGDGDDFYASQPDFNESQAYAAPSVATQSIRAPSPPPEIGRASCRERVCPYV